MTKNETTNIPNRIAILHIQSKVPQEKVASYSPGMDQGIPPKRVGWSLFPMTDRGSTAESPAEIQESWHLRCKERKIECWSMKNRCFDEVSGLLIGQINRLNSIANGTAACSGIEIATCRRCVADHWRLCAKTDFGGSKESKMGISYRLTRWAIACSMAMGLLVQGTTVRAVEIVDDPVQIDEQLAKVVQSTNTLCWEMYRYHQMQPDYKEAYQTGKDIWAQAARLRDAFRAGPVETDSLISQVTDISSRFARLEALTQKWGNGDLSAVPKGGEPVQQILTQPAVDIEVPFVGLRIGGPAETVVTETPGPASLQRIRLHPNSHGSRRCLDRLANEAKLSISYLLEDAGVSEGAATSDIVPAAAPVPDSQLKGSSKVVPANSRKPGDPTPRK